jgi:prolyl oligopeptidase
MRQERVHYTSRDGTQVQMVIISGPGSGPRPAILTGYGGFGVRLLPEYSPTIAAWTAAGGIYAIAELRGGGEGGERWHEAGRLGQKQNVIDDFTAAAETLIAGRWTTAGQLAASGVSDGGLTVGAAFTQRPGLFAAAVCTAPLLDMARYELFGLGPRWRHEYGTAADYEQLSWLLSYSPYHNVREGVVYPAVLLAVFDNDSRVDPMHSRKMCAMLQHAAGPSERPVLLRREQGVGHGPRGLTRFVDLHADILAFIAHNTGMRDPKWDSRK